MTDFRHSIALTTWDFLLLGQGFGSARGLLTWLSIECLASGSCVGSALCSAADRRLMNNFGMCAGELQNIINIMTIITDWHLVKIQLTNLPQLLNNTKWICYKRPAYCNVEVIIMPEKLRCKGNIKQLLSRQNYCLGLLFCSVLPRLRFSDDLLDQHGSVFWQRQKLANGLSKKREKQTCKPHFVSLCSNKKNLLEWDTLPLKLTFK